MVHEGKKNNHQCASCCKSFGEHAGNLKKHMKNIHKDLNAIPDISTVHEGDKAYICESCGKSFTTCTSLKKHVILVHEGKKTHQCATCGKYFGEAGHLNRHVKNVHNDVGGKRNKIKKKS